MSGLAKLLREALDAKTIPNAPTFLTMEDRLVTRGWFERAYAALARKAQQAREKK